MLRRILSLIVKELLALLRDAKSRFVVIVPPLVQLFVFSYAATYDVTSIRLAVLDESRTQESRALLAAFQGAPAFAELVPVARDDDLSALVERRAVTAALHIPPRFAADLRTDPPARVSLVLDGRMSNTAQIVHGYVTAILLDFGRAWGAAHGWPAPPSVIVERVWFNPNMESLWVVVPGLAGVLTMVVALVVTALSVARERELGTFEQLLVTPLRPVEILIGKTVPALIIGLLEATLIVVAAQVWFGVPLTAPVWLLYGALTVFLLSIIGVGLFISSLVQTQQQAIVGAFLFLVPAIILSGFATPLDNMPPWLQAATWVNPLRHMMVILRGVFLKDAAPALVLDSLWPMAVIAVGTLAGAAWLFRRRLG
ncbi:ABC transporter permease [Caenispirillum bisanense]|uniref:ABC-2 type transport system permease protein n=1 Tax=Caenispirillum bisanense TaxID=414052 RepID=A0A286GDP1_9PROT|nr:ABC transporter permease [Caenispirillum bisanense]SOD93612.1 ABC-2 type transport system permease protein [Caenispirillum bisanense]